MGVTVEAERCVGAERARASESERKHGRADVCESVSISGQQVEREAHFISLQRLRDVGGGSIRTSASASASQNKSALTSTSKRQSHKSKPE